MLSGRIAEMGVLRRSPAGVSILNFTVTHSSGQIEAGVARQVDCEVSAVALADAAARAFDLKPGDKVKLTGFLARKGRASSQLVLHVNSIVVE